MFFLLEGKSRPVAARFHSMLQPLQPLGDADEPEFRPDRMAVGLLQMFHDIPKLCRAQACFAARLEYGVQIGFGEFEIFQIKSGTVFSSRTNRVCFGEQVTARPVIIYQVEYSALLP